MDIFDLSAMIRLDSSQYESGLASAGNSATSFSSEMSSAMTEVVEAGTTALSTVVAAADTVANTLESGGQEVSQYGNDVDDMSQSITSSAQAHQELDSAMQNSGTALSSMQSGMKALIDVTKGGIEVFTSITGTIVNMAQSFVSTAGDVAEYGDNIDKMSQKMGLSAQAYQEWDAIMQHSGTSMETMKAGMKTLANAVENGNEAFQRIGLTQEQIASMSQEDLFAATIAGLQNVDNETERTYLAGQLLGRGATELGALLNTSAEDTEAMRQRVHELGGVMSDEAVKASAAYQDSLQDMQTAFSGLKNNMMAQFLPSITTVMDGIADIFSGDSDSGIGLITSGINSLFDKVGEMIPGVAQIATQIISALSETFILSLPDIVESGVSIIATLSQSLFDNLPLIGDALMGVGEVIISTLEQYGPTMLEQGLSMLMNLALGIVENVPAVLDALAQGVDQAFAKLDESLPGFLEKGFAAVEQLAMGIIQDLPSIISSLGHISTSAISFLMEHLPDFWQKGIELVMNIAKGIIDNLPEIISAITGVLADLIATIAEHLPDFLNKGLELLGQVAAGIIQAVPDLLAEIPGILEDVASKFLDHDWGSIGMNIINGIASGVTEFASNLADAAIGAVGDAWDGICDWLGIASPSKKAQDVIGKNWALGIGVGFERNMPESEMTGAVESAMKDMQDALAANPFDIPVTATVSRQDSIRAGGDINTALYELLAQYLPQISADKNIYFNDGAWAGRLAPSINEELGRIAQWEAAQ